MLHYCVTASVACITLDHPPANALCLALRSELVSAFQRADLDASVRAVVIHGAGRGFCAGGDIREFGTPAAGAAPALSLDVHPVIEAMSKPVVAVIHGWALGGGLETALVCHYRIAETNAKIGLPEVPIGTIPLSGTQRLPRLMPLSAAIDWILSGKIVLAETLADTSLFDQLVPPGAALARAMALAAEVSARPLVRHRALAPENGVLAATRLRLQQGQASAASHKALAAIAAAYASPDFDSGMREARTLYASLMADQAVVDARDRFFKKTAQDPGPI
jgi:enoyl-CoA hydratase